MATIGQDRGCLMAGAAMTYPCECIYAPLDHWLLLLAQGWRPVGLVVAPMRGGWSVLLWRPA